MRHRLGRSIFIAATCVFLLGAMIVALTLVETVPATTAGPASSAAVLTSFKSAAPAANSASSSQADKDKNKKDCDKESSNCPKPKPRPCDKKHDKDDHHPDRDRDHCRKPSGSG